MKTRFVLFFISFTLSLYSQKLLNDLSFNVGIGVGKPDDRLGKTITGPPGILAYITNEDNYTNDNWYFGYIDKGIDLGKDYKLRTGLGYQQHISDYPNYYNNIYWDDKTFIILLIGKYRNQMIFHTLNIEKSIKTKKLTFGLQIWNNFSVRKSMYSSIEKFYNANVYSRHKSRTLYQSCELLPYIKYSYKNIFAMAAIRVFHLKWRDEALGSAEEEVDSYNPLKVNFTLGYCLDLDNK